MVVASDLRVTDPFDIERGYPHAVLKAVTVTADLCVAFAGPVDRALDGLHSAAELARSPFEAVLARLAALSGTGGESPEFLLVSSKPVRVARCRGGVAEDHLSAAWIGDQAAFEVFQRLQLSAPPIQGGLPRHQLVGAVSAAFGALVRTGQVPSVGEADIVIATRADGALEYMTRAIMFGPMRPQMIPPGVPTLVNFGSAATGGHAYSVLTPTEPGHGAVGLHFFQGRLGLLYHPLKARKPFAYPSVTHDEFRAAVTRDHGFDIQGVMIG